MAVICRNRSGGPDRRVRLPVFDCLAIGTAQFGQPPVHAPTAVWITTIRSLL
ncbi:hypothetical protein NSERUTF1_2510 [Nocardia seriolae]|nr:hypothetical protein NSERUTF1_2510 [Nocardia seriolae]